MFNDLFRIFLSLLATIIQLVLYPFNQIFVLAFPNISTRITETITNLTHIFDGMSWALGLIPSQVKITLLLILGLEIAKHSAYITAHLIVKAWNLIQKLKFW